jgi:hypothetical protein
MKYLYVFEYFFDLFENVALLDFQVPSKCIPMLMDGKHNFLPILECQLNKCELKLADSFKSAIFEQH